VYALLATALKENPPPLAIALTVADAVSEKLAVYCFVVPAPGEGVVPSVV
jgi:hypothetical protein